MRYLLTPWRSCFCWASARPVPAVRYSCPFHLRNVFSGLLPVPSRPYSGSPTKYILGQGQEEERRPFVVTPLPQGGVFLKLVYLDFEIGPYIICHGSEAEFLQFHFPYIFGPFRGPPACHWSGQVEAQKSSRLVAFSVFPSALIPFSSGFSLKITSESGPMFIAILRSF